MTERTVEVTHEELPLLIKAAYRLSKPQGMGFLHFKEGELSDEQTNEIIERSKEDPWCAVSMDYVNGRSCKFHVKRTVRGDFESPLSISYPWYDHGFTHWDKLVKELMDSREN